MKIQRQLSKKRGKKEYYRYTVNLPEGLVKKAALKAGDELEGEAKKGEVRLKRKK